jgi:acetylornithine/succinyldiaminopimelate/putrescine aminotransferase
LRYDHYLRGTRDPTVEAAPLRGVNTNLEEDTAMQDITTVVNRYIDMWNEPREDARQELVANTLTDDATYVDPVMSGTGVQGIASMIGAAQAQYPGHRFALVSAPDAHHGRVRFTWSLSPEGGDPVAIGVDFATIADDGRLESVTGFLEGAS